MKAVGILCFRAFRVFRVFRVFRGCLLPCHGCAAHGSDPDFQPRNTRKARKESLIAASILRLRSTLGGIGAICSWYIENPHFKSPFRIRVCGDCCRRSGCHAVPGLAGGHALLSSTALSGCLAVEMGDLRGRGCRVFPNSSVRPLHVIGDIRSHSTGTNFMGQVLLEASWTT